MKLLLTEEQSGFLESAATVVHYENHKPIYYLNQFFQKEGEGKYSVLSFGELPKEIQEAVVDLRKDEVAKSENQTENI